MPSSPSPGPLLPVRAAVVLLIAAIIGLVAGVVAYFAYGAIPDAVLVGGAATGGSLALFHSLLAVENTPPPE